MLVRKIVVVIATRVETIDGEEALSAEDCAEWDDVDSCWVVFPIGEVEPAHVPKEDWQLVVQ